MSSFMLTDGTFVTVHGEGKCSVNGSIPDWRELQARLQAASDVTVSVVVPNRNYARMIGECLETVQESVRRAEVPCEILVVDDCSTDNSHSVVSEFSGVRLIPLVATRPGGHYGAATGRNIGVSLAVGHYVIFADSDDHVLPEYIGHYLDVLKRSEVERVTGAHIRFYPNHTPRREDERRLCTQRLASIAAYPRAVPLVLGGWSPNAYQLEDLEADERFDAVGYRYAVTSRPLYRWRRYVDETTKTRYHKNGETGDEYWRARINAGRAVGGEFPLVRPPLLDANGMPFRYITDVLAACGARERTPEETHAERAPSASAQAAPADNG